MREALLAHSRIWNCVWNVMYVVLRRGHECMPNNAFSFSDSSRLASPERKDDIYM